MELKFSSSDILQNSLLELVANQLFSFKTSIVFHEDSFGGLWEEAQIQTVPLIAFSQFPIDSFPQKMQVKVQETLRSLFQRNISITRGHVYIDRLLNQAGIPYVVLKGLASALHYPDYLMRSMGDVDFLVDAKDFEKANEVFKENGFQVIKGFDDHHVTYSKNGVRYELHFEPPGIPKGETGEYLRNIFSDIISNSVRVSTEFGEVSVPNAFHHGLIVLLHNVHHLTGDGMGLRHLCDWAVIIHAMNEETFSQCFEEKLRDVGLWHFAMVMSYLCKEILHCSDVVGSFATEDVKRQADELLNDIFTAGNFGQKNVDRSHEYLLISSKNQKGIKEKSMAAQWVLSMNRIVYVHWPFAKKIKILLPFGWTVYGVRYIYRSLRGKRPQIRVKSVFGEAQKRKNFYHSLKLFENPKQYPSGDENETEKS